MCILISSLFLGGYLLDLSGVIKTVDPINSKTPLFSIILDGLIPGIILGIKSSMFVFAFILVRAALPRARFDQLMSFC